MIFKQIYLTYRWDPNKYYHFELEWNKQYVSTPPLHMSRMRNKVNLKPSIAGLNSEFSFA